MGLDMYLRARRYVSGWTRVHTADEQNEWERLLSLYGMEDFIADGSPHAYVEFTVGYWRKANHIHGWFVNVVQNGEDECRPHYVSRAQLKDLKEACLTVIAYPESGRSVLPPAQGFFFGTYEMGDYYREECDRTVKLIDHVLELPDEWDFAYQSSW